MGDYSYTRLLQAVEEMKEDLDFAQKEVERHIGLRMKRDQLLQVAKNNVAGLQGEVRRRDEEITRLTQQRNEARSEVNHLEERNDYQITKWDDD